MKFDMHPMSHSGTSSVNSSAALAAADNFSKHLHASAYVAHLYHDLPPADGDTKSTGASAAGPYSSDMDLANMGSKFGIILPNPAPEVDPTNDASMSATMSSLPQGSSAGTHSGVPPTRSMIWLMFLFSHCTHGVYVLF